MSVIEINREIVSTCKCGGQLWYILIDKPKYEKIIGFKCSFCGDRIQVEIKPEKPK